MGNESIGLFRRDATGSAAPYLGTPRESRADTTTAEEPSGAFRGLSPNAPSDPTRLSFAPLCAARAPLRAGSWARSARAPGGRSGAPSVLF